MKADELLPCPFCAGAYLPTHPKISQTAPSTSMPMLEELTGGRGWRVCCYGCGVQTWNNLQYTRQQAVAAWNTRQANPDTKRLDWLIANGYTPAKWRPWDPRRDGPARNYPNGQVFLEFGSRAEIDQAMQRSLPAPPAS